MRAFRLPVIAAIIAFGGEGDRANLFEVYRADLNPTRDLAILILDRSRALISNAKG